MCNNCPGKKYGQEQTEARDADRVKLDKVRLSRETRAQRKANANLN